VRRRLRDGQVWRLLALLSGPAVWIPTCVAGDSLTAVPSVNGPEVMLYFSQPIGPSAPARSYGLRIDQHSLPAMLPGATANAADLAGRREIVNLRMAAHENMRLDLGRRVSWDFSRRQFNLAGDLPAMMPRFRTGGLAAVGAPTPLSQSLASKTVAAGALRPLPALP
jgi:hypothetical protein